MLVMSQIYVALVYVSAFFMDLTIGASVRMCRPSPAKNTPIFYIVIFWSIVSKCNGYGFETGVTIRKNVVINVNSKAQISMCKHFSAFELASSK